MGDNISKEYIWIYQDLYTEYEHVKYYNRKRNIPVKEWARYFAQINNKRRSKNDQ